jgi:FkbM family methyltransferase
MTSLVATPEDIRFAFRLLLGREADPGGQATFEHLIEASPVAPAELADLIMASPEYRQRRSDDELVRNDLDGYAVFSRKGDALIGAYLRQGVAYEPYVMEAFDAALASANVVLDVGANIGIFTMRAASRIPATGTVIAVEPLAQNLRALYAGIEYNGFRNVQVFPFAASDAPGLVWMGCNADSSNGILGAAAVDGNASTTAPAHRLDQLLAFLDRLDVIKIDIEGHEPIAWRGLSGLLQRFRPVVFAEFSPVAIGQRGLATAEQFAEQMLGYSPRIQVLHRDQAPVTCDSAAKIMAEWEAANHRLGLDGELHIDLPLDPARSG